MRPRPIELFGFVDEHNEGAKGEECGISARRVPGVEGEVLGMHIWACGYFVSTAGVDREVIRNYVKEQQEDRLRDDQFRFWKDNSEWQCHALLPGKT